MSMSDCSECWETPCVCGNEYKDWSLEELKEFRKMISKVIAEKESEVTNEG